MHASAARPPQRRSRILLFLLGAALALALGFSAPPAEAGPFDGKGSWVWYVSASGGSPAEIARDADRNGIDVVYVKSSDGRSYWSQFDRGLVRALHGRGIEACAWAFVYGDDPSREARVSARAVERGADCLVIDAEGTYEGRYEQAYRYVHRLRRLLGRDYPLALSSFPYVDYHPAFPYSVFLGAGGAQSNLPQIYWHAIGTTVRKALVHTYRWNRPYARRLYPVGQTWQDPPKRQILDFRRYAREFGAPGVSWWSWQETSSPQWRLIGRPLKRGITGFDAPRDYADLQRGDRGDLVLYAQELLRAWNVRVAPSGLFNRKLARAVAGYQLEHGLETNGRINDTTWRELLQRQPRSTNWERVKVPDALSRPEQRNASRASAPPRSATAGEELPPTLGRP